jgi:type I restriction enzyme, S subunit
VRSGDFLISRANTSELVAKAVRVKDSPQNLILCDKIVRLRFGEFVSEDFLLLVNNHALHVRDHYAQKASGTSPSMKNVSRELIYEALIPLPPLAEQKRIVAKVDELMALCDALEAALKTSQAESNRLLEALLAEVWEDAC